MGPWGELFVPKYCLAKLFESSVIIDTLSDYLSVLNIPLYRYMNRRRCYTVDICSLPGNYSTNFSLHPSTMTIHHHQTYPSIKL